MIRVLFGGSFDPIHRGHRAMIGELLERGLADVVHVVPAARSPFKAGTSASPEERLVMCGIALDKADGVVLEDLEIVRGGTSYTIDTLRTLQQRHPDDIWRLALGADSLESLPRWRESDALRNAAGLIVFPRVGVTIADGIAVAVVDGFSADVSSSDVREALAAGDVPDHLLPPGVADHIRRLGLYAPDPTGGPSCP